MRKLFKTIFRKLGLDLNRCDPTKMWLDVADTPHGRRAAILKENSIDLVLDVGAHKGWYSADLRAFGYTGRIISFEPQLAPFQELEKRSCDDPLWEVSRNALGDIDDTAILHVSGSPESSSLLDILPAHTDALTNSKVIGKEEISVSRLDSIFDQYCNPSDRVFLKMDVQGFEKKILAGAGVCLDRILGIQMEMSLKPLYDGEALFHELYNELLDKGFKLVWTEPGFRNEESGELLQLDGIFIR